MSCDSYQSIPPFLDESLNPLRDKFDRYFKEQEQLSKDMAAKVFDAVSNHPKDAHESIVARFVPGTQEITLSNPVGEALDAVISNCLDHHSIGYFIELILKNHESAKQSASSLKGHSKHHASKQMVFAWCDTNMHLWPVMDEAAWDIAQTFIPEKFRAVRNWMTEWKKLRSTGTP